MAQITTFLSEHPMIVGLIYVFLCWLLLQMIEMIFKRAHRKKAASIKDSFFKSILQAFLVIVTFLRVISLSSHLESITETILMSSSLLVVVLGFIFQEGLSNIVHGFILTIFKPFEIGDRVEVTTGTGVISGYVKQINLRHTTIRGLSDNVDTIVSNSLMDNATIRNLNMEDNHIRYPLTVTIPYDEAQDPDKLKLAKKIIAEESLADSRTVDVRTDPDAPVHVNVGLGESGVDLTCFIYTKTAEDNYFALSDIRENLLRRFGENDLNFAFPHVEVSGSLENTNG